MNIGSQIRIADVSKIVNINFRESLEKYHLPNLEDIWGTNCKSIWRAPKRDETFTVRASNGHQAFLRTGVVPGGVF